MRSATRVKGHPTPLDRLEVPRWNRSRLAAAVVLASWSVMFWFLLISGRVNLYLSTRTSWVVPVGAVTLGAAAIGVFAVSRTRASHAINRRDAFVSAVLILPVILVMSSPRTTLGTFSASRKTQFSGRGLWTYWGTFNKDSEISLFFVAAAKYWPQANDLLAQRAGSDVDFVGFVDREPSTPADEFTLTRFVVSCCVADAAVVSIRVVNVPPGQVTQDQWVEVTGQIYPIGSEMILTATSIAPVQTPQVPYLTP